MNGSRRGQRASVRDNTRARGDCCQGKQGAGDGARPCSVGMCHFDFEKVTESGPTKGCSSPSLFGTYPGQGIFLFFEGFSLKLFEY